MGFSSDPRPNTALGAGTVSERIDAELSVADVGILRWRARAEHPSIGIPGNNPSPYGAPTANRYGAPATNTGANP